MPRAFRSTSDRWVGGVAGGVAEHLGVRSEHVRWTFALLVLASGFGLVLYAALWLVLPSDRAVRRDRAAAEAPGLVAAERAGLRTGRRTPLAVAGAWAVVGALVLGGVGLFGALTGTTGFVWPLLLAGAGLAALWRQADVAEEERLAGGRLGILGLLLGRGGLPAYARLVGGVTLLVAALAVLLVGRSSLGGGLLVVVVVGVVTGPWVARLARGYLEERAERVRSEERADVATHLHDSVLQTLALIQRSAHDPATVSRLARGQERELRTWLFADRPTGGALDLAEGLRTAAASVEDGTGVTVDVVVVGDLAADDPLVEPLVAAAREAVTNAARHSGAPSVDVYAEVAPDLVEVFVRDRGRGFEVTEVAEDRRGLRHSIAGRLERAGGTSHVRTHPGWGTEVTLRVPRPAEAAR
ncbi:PspC domain-containing protein [Nocardioidaceae bacterium]|nr:PspC domain-containing protein [Nocardioidaceae bacterium]